MSITAADRETYDRDGVVCLRGVIDRSQATSLLAAWDQTASDFTAHGLESTSKGTPPGYAWRLRGQASQPVATGFHRLHCLHAGSGAGRAAGRRRCRRFLLGSDVRQETRHDREDLHGTTTLQDILYADRRLSVCGWHCPACRPTMALNA